MTDVTSPGRPRIVLTRRLPEEVEQALSARFDAIIPDTDEGLDPHALLSAMRESDAILCTVADRLGADILGVRDARVRLVANYGVGTDHVDLDAARSAGIRVTNTPGVLTEDTADLAFLLLLAAARRAGEGERQVRAGAWRGWRPTHLLGRAVHGATLGIVGFGRIGRAVARRARGFGMSVIYHSRTRAGPDVESELAAEWVDSLDELLTRAEFVSLHTPGGPETKHLLDARRLAIMRPAAILVNTARGNVVDEPALAAALRDGALGAAGLDVYEREPMADPALLALENVVLLPHLGSATVATRVSMGMRALANLEAFFSGRDTPDTVV